MSKNWVTYEYILKSLSFLYKRRIVTNIYKKNEEWCNAHACQVLAFLKHNFQRYCLKTAGFVGNFQHTRCYLRIQVYIVCCWHMFQSFVLRLKLKAFVVLFVIQLGWCVAILLFRFIYFYYVLAFSILLYNNFYNFILYFRNNLPMKQYYHSL